MIKICILEARHLSLLKPKKEAFHLPNIRINVHGEYEEDRMHWNVNEKVENQKHLNGVRSIWNTTLSPHLIANKEMSFIEFIVSEVKYNTDPLKKFDPDQ